MILISIFIYTIYPNMQDYLKNNNNILPSSNEIVDLYIKSIDHIIKNHLNKGKVFMIYIINLLKNLIKIYINFKTMKNKKTSQQ